MAFNLDQALAATSEGKALPAHPALMSMAPTSVYTPGQPRKGAVITQREAGRHSDAYGGGQAIDHVYDSINLYADPVATAPFRLERLDGTKLVRQKIKGTPPDHEVGPKDLYDLLDRPNPFMYYDELMSLLVIDLLLVGNAYWYKWQVTEAGKPLALYRLAPSHVKIVPGERGPIRYEYKPPGQRDPLEIAPEDIIHFRRPNPHSSYYGMGVVQGAGRTMDLDLAVTDTMAAYYENRADPSLIIESERRVPRDVFNKLRAQMRARLAGSKRAGELLVLESGLKASSLSVNARDALFAELSKMSRDRIYTKFRASPMLFGLMDEVTGGNKVSDARREFDNYTLRPFMSKLVIPISHALTEAWDCKLILDYRQILPPEEAIKVGESVAKVPGIKIREVRRQYEQFGIEESTGDPELDEEILNLPLGELDENGQPVNPGQKSGADQPLSSEPGRPPKPSNTTSIGNASKGQKAFADIDRLLTLRALEEAAEGKAGPVSTPAPDNRLPGEQRPADTFAAIRTTDINRSTTDITSGLRDAVVELERGLLDTVEGKALKTGDIVSRMRKSAAWDTFKTRVAEVIEDGMRKAAASGVMHTGLTPDDDVDYDEIINAVLHRPEGGLRTVVKTLKDRVANRVKDARDTDAERSDYETAIRAVTSEWADSQAVLIADSEATEAYNEATLTVSEMSGVKSFYVVEEDDAPDAACQEAGGQVWDLATARANRKEHPRCRRAFLPLTDAAVA